MAAQAARTGHRSLYVTGEESAAQVRLRADRIGAVDPTLYLAAETDLGAVLGHVDAVAPDLLVVDSVQTISSSRVSTAAPGGVTQVREVADAAHPRSPRSAASPRCWSATSPRTARSPARGCSSTWSTSCCSFEGDRHSRLRLVRAVKNRYGAADEVGCFDLDDDGITGLRRPERPVPRRTAPSPCRGTCVTVTLEGRRPLVAEVQALVTAAAASPRRGGRRRGWTTPASR